VEVVVNIADQTDPAGQQQHGTDACGVEILDATPSSSWILLAVSIGSSRSSPGRFSMWSSILCRRSCSRRRS
jgi:hypothetical protein